MASTTYNLARFDLTSLRLALACAQRGTLTLAAREANLALAAASRRLRELEAALGTPLFERSAQGLTLTAAGHEFVSHALVVLGAVDRLAVSVRDQARGVTRHVRLAAGTAALNQFLPSLLARWHTQHPQVRIEVAEDVSLRVAQSVREHRADVGIVVEGVDLRGLGSRLFRHDELVVLLPPKHRLARGRTRLTFADLLGEDWIGLKEGAAVLARQQQMAAECGRPLRLRMQVQSFDAACRLVAEGLGLALLPHDAVASLARSLGLPLRRLADAWSRRRLLVVWRLDAPEPLTLDVAAFLAHDAQDLTLPQ
jgi:DNA-binding transcriptional LysR family regulator